jgi:hypothetical protein
MARKNNRVTVELPVITLAELKLTGDYIPEPVFKPVPRRRLAYSN